MSSFAISEDPDEMHHYAAFHQGLHCEVKKRSSDKRITYFFKNYNWTPLDMCKGLS